MSCAPRAPWGGAGVQLQGVGELYLQGGPGIHRHPQKYRSQGAPNHQERQSPYLVSGPGQGDSLVISLNPL